jgi:para-nitrobenzyl esterase
MRKITCLAFLCLVTISTMAQNTNAFAVQASITNGIIEGNYDTKSGIQTYFGVPFAKPPVSNLRWKAPQPVDNWIGVKQTKNLAQGRCKFLCQHLK